MHITVQELIEFEYFRDMKLIAGSNGLQNKLTDCGILDYEFDQKLKGKYLYNTFHKNQFALSTFLYAKNNPFLIGEAVKYLVGKGASGLAIKNVFHLTIHESVLRYADSKGFPIFIISNTGMYFEDIIINISDCIRNLNKANFCEQISDTLLYQTLSPKERISQAYALNPSFRTQYIVLYFKKSTPISTTVYHKYYNAYYSSELFLPQNLLFLYRGNLIFIHSSELLKDQKLLPKYSDWCSLLSNEEDDFHIGISTPHYRLEEINQALQEAIFASAFHESLNLPYLRFSDMGSYRFILPLLNQPELQQFSNSILEPIMEFDVENNSSLLITLLEMVRCEGNLHKLSIVLSQHENTLRYRFKKIKILTGLNYRIPAHYEQLSVAAKVYIATTTLS